MDWLLWFFMPSGWGNVYRRTAIDGTSWTDSRNEGELFGLCAKIVFVVITVGVGLFVECGGGAGLGVGLGAIAFVAFILAWTVFPGISSVRAYANRNDDRWARRRPLSPGPRAKRGRGRDCR